MKNTWICEQEKTLITSPVLDIVERNCRSSEDGRPFKFYLLRSRNWCNIIPVTEDGKIVMVKQYRIGISDHTIEVPGGVADETDSDSQAAAIREMEEETGYAPLPNAKCELLGTAFPNPAFMDNTCYSFVIGPVRKVKNQKLDMGEMIEVVEVPIADIPGLIQEGKINHALMLNTFFFLAMKSQATAEALKAGLEEFLG